MQYLHKNVFAKYCDECLSVSVCAFVCLSVCLSAMISSEPHARSLPILFVRVAYVRGSVLLQHVDDRPHRLSAGLGVTGVHCASEVQSTIALFLLISQPMIGYNLVKFIFAK